jgi:hypothetical protein
LFRVLHSCLIFLPEAGRARDVLVRSGRILECARQATACFFYNTYIHQVCCYLYGSLLAHDLFVGLLPYLFLSRLGCSWFGWMARAGDRLARKRRSGRNDTSLVAADGSFRVGETCPSPTDELYLDVGLLYPTSWTKGPAGFSRLFLKILLP